MPSLISMMPQDFYKTNQARMNELQSVQGGGVSSLEQIHSYSINSSLIQFKVIHRIHYSKTKLHKIEP